MVRAIFFDFYGVWTPDPFIPAFRQALQQYPDSLPQIHEILQKYYLGHGDAEFIASSLRFKFNMPDADAKQFTLPNAEVAPALIEFFHALHAHFLKVGVLGNIGQQELEFLQKFNDKNQLLETITGPVTTGAPLLSEETLVTGLQEIGEPPENCLVVTNDPEYQQTAQEWGMMVLPFTGLGNLWQEIQRLLSAENPATPGV